MESIYIIAIIFFFLESLIYFISPISITFLSIILLGYFFWIFKIKNIEIYVFSILFLLRIILGINFNNYNIGDIVEIKTEILNGRGKIEKIDNKFLKDYKSIYVENIEEGNYKFIGEIKKIQDKYLILDIFEKEKRVEKDIEIILEKKIIKLRKNLSNGCVNLIKAMILGDKSNVYREVENKFRYSGASHLLAISGLHIGIISGIILYALDKLLLKKEIKYILGLIILSIYVFSIKISPSVIRAYIMGVVYIIGNIIYEKNDIKKSFLVAFIINLLIYPNSFSNISFLMSYLCVFTILWIYPKFQIQIKVKMKNLWNYLIFLFSIQIILTPLTLYFFNTINFLSFFTNIILTPIGSVFIILGFGAIIIPSIFSKFYLMIVEGTYILLEKFLNLFEKLPYLSLKIENKIDFKMIIFFYIIIFGIIFSKELKSYLKNQRKI
ncbi:MULTISPECIES: ComEC/Rec2 family competence protein [Fusobacterium]|uniref:ComEC/Rec2 family competence protein n=1 Tax=Fusobacterium TaxID=848 RepID=UPI00147775CE|nr:MULTISPECIES: ComEC/Rec2 family competence protein [Fusobacterium]NME36540.1 ComEC/Rec2 family competence protein [Fusobacterium sp. FSA-380-WT-3A]